MSIFELEGIENRIQAVYSLNIPFGEEHDFESGASMIPERDWVCYILRFESEIYKIGRAYNLKQRLFGYRGDIKYNRTLDGARNFSLIYLIKPKRSNPDQLELALTRLCRPYRVKEECFRGLDKRLEYALSVLSEGKKMNFRTLKSTHFWQR